MKHLIDAKDLEISYIEKLISVAEDIINHPKKYAKTCEGKILASLFFEPSTRTRLSFESAMFRLGGDVLGFSSAEMSSAAKGESVSDTAKIMSSYADISVIRHPKEGAAFVAANHSSIPVINGGDGGHQHPTQTLSDLLTIKLEKGKLEDMTIGFCGDLMFGRTVHSLIETLIKYPNNTFYFISPEELRIPAYITEQLEEHNITFYVTDNLEEHLPNLDILYMTRVQAERFFNEDEYIRLKNVFLLNNKKLQQAKEDLIIMHPLPRVNEIAVEVDKDPRAKYFKQAEYGKFIRMALLLDLLEVEYE